MKLSALDEVGGRGRCQAVNARRQLCLVLLGMPLLAFLRAARAKRVVPRIGLLSTGSPRPSLPRPVEALREALRDLGYVEGQTLQIEYRWAEGKLERLPELAAGLVLSRVDLIVASGDNAIRAAMQATNTLPIVMAYSGDAVGAGFVRSLARPGGNVAGMTSMAPELGAKRLQLLKTLHPEMSQVTVLWNPADPVHALEWN